MNGLVVRRSMGEESLPAWVVDDRQSVRAEAEPYVGMSPEQRARHLKAACRAAARMLRSRHDAERALTFEDPLSDSSQRALERLRREARDRRRKPRT